LSGAATLNREVSKKRRRTDQKYAGTGHRNTSKKKDQNKKENTKTEANAPTEESEKGP